MASPTIYRLRVTLDDIEPPVWRELLVPADVTLPVLHRIIQLGMGWQGTHLHRFLMGRREYLDPDPKGIMRLEHERDERRVRLNALLRTPGQTLLYEYDFGDEWQHTIALEAIVAATPGAAYPMCVDAAGACPPEHCGGPIGYRDLLALLADSAHPNYRAFRDWVGAAFDPSAVDIAVINAALRTKLPGAWSTGALSRSCR